MPLNTAKNEIVGWIQGRAIWGFGIAMSHEILGMMLQFTNIIWKIPVLLSLLDEGRGRDLDVSGAVRLGNLRRKKCGQDKDLTRSKHEAQEGGLRKSLFICMRISSREIQWREDNRLNDYEKYGKYVVQSTLLCTPAGMVSNE